MALMARWSLDTVREALLESGRIAMRHFAAPGATHKTDNSIVTEADVAIESYLRSTLGGDDVAILGEEEPATDHAALADQIQHGTAWVLDPIDGTAPYANQLPNWGISIGYLENGRFSRGAIFLPRTGEVVITEGDGVLYQRMSRDPASWRMDDLAPLEPRDATYSAAGMITVPQSIHSRSIFTGNNPVQAIGSAVYAATKLLLGQYICYVAKIRLWDIAAAVALLRAAGHTIVFADGTPLDDRVIAEQWVLDGDASSLWYARGQLFMAHDPTTLEHVRAHYRYERK